MAILALNAVKQTLKNTQTFTENGHILCLWL